MIRGQKKRWRSGSVEVGPELLASAIGELEQWVASLEAGGDDLGQAEDVRRIIERLDARRTERMHRVGIASMTLEQRRAYNAQKTREYRLRRAN